MKVAPISMAEARRWLSVEHRHLRTGLTGWLFGVQILDDQGFRIGVACAGRPKARALQDGRTIEITRVAVREGNPNACSFSYGALRRAAVALGYTRVVTYTLPEEGGASLRAAGFVEDGRTKGGEWDCPSRSRRPAERADRKVRWVWHAGGAT